MGPTLFDRMKNLENCYKDIVDAMPILHKLDRAIMGYWEADGNAFVPGLVQKVEAIANGRKTGHRRIWAILNIVKEIAVGVSILVLAYMVGIRGMR